MTRSTITNAPIEATGFDTLAWSEMLRSSGISKKQAEAQVRVIAQAVQNGAATRGDLERVESNVRSDMNMLRSDLETVDSSMRSELNNVESRLESKIETSYANLKVDILRWMFGMFLAQTALILTVLRHFGQ